jgi:hypothetical protein
VSMNWNLNDTILQRRTLFCLLSICGEAALCH